MPCKQVHLHHQILEALLFEHVAEDIEHLAVERAEQAAALTDTCQKLEAELRKLELQQQGLVLRLEDQAQIIRRFAPDFLPTARELCFDDIAALAGEGEALISLTVTAHGTLILVITQAIQDFVPGTTVRNRDAIAT